MIRVVIKRFCYSKCGTFGELYLYNGQENIGKALYTVEQPWQNNEPFLSCIPEGTYRCERFSSVKNPNTWQVMDVPGRVAILFHPGNTKDDFQGCIGLGLDLGTVNSKWAVVGSKMAHNIFNEHLKDINGFTLDIVQQKGAKL